MTQPPEDPRRSTKKKKKRPTGGMGAIPLDPAPNRHDSPSLMQREKEAQSKR